MFRFGSKLMKQGFNSCTFNTPKQWYTSWSNHKHVKAIHEASLVLRQERDYITSKMANNSTNLSAQDVFSSQLILYIISLYWTPLILMISMSSNK